MITLNALPNFLVPADLPGCPFCRGVELAPFHLYGGNVFGAGPLFQIKRTLLKVSSAIELSRYLSVQGFHPRSPLESPLPFRHQK